LSYNSKLQKSKEKVYNYAVATKILDLMEKLRLDENENSSRRWIWELMQNAKDVAYEGTNVSIEIDFQSDDKNRFVEFRHNGKPFSTDNITFLVEQVSTKERDSKEGTKPKTTGKFGTGFLTTHLLSEEVEIEGVVKEPDEPYRKFSLVLDRTGRDIDGIIDSLNNSLTALENIDSQQPYDRYLPGDFNTVFRYKLDENSIGVAQKGLKDLHTSLIFTLVFLPEITSVNIIHEKIQYELSQNVLEEGDDIKIYTVIKKFPNGVAETKIALLTKNNASIAVEIKYENDQIVLQKFDSSVAKLFCDFPLVGSEYFSFPVIINSAAFNPNEPRNGIYLTDKSDPKIEENKSIIVEAVELYYSLLEYASRHNWGNIHLLATIPTIKEKEWMSKKWVEDEVLYPIRRKLLRTAIVDTERHGRVSIINDSDKPNAWFPSSSKKDLRHKIWELANVWIPSMLPRRADIDTWYDIIWSDCSRLSVDALTLSIQHKSELSELEAVLTKSTNPVEWLNSYFELLNLDEECLSEVANDKYAVIPNQYGKFKKKSELVNDGQIQEELKNVLSILGADPRDFLKHREIRTGRIEHPVKKQEDVIVDINRIIAGETNSKIAEACDHLVTLFSNHDTFPSEREAIFQFCKTVYPNDVNTKKEINEWSIDIWKEADKREMQWVTKAISEAGDISALTKELKFGSNSETFEWLNSFISFLTTHNFDHLLNRKDAPVLPNQHGRFQIKDELFLDGEIDEDLKDISAELGYDFRDELLDVSIYLALSQNRTRSEVHIAEEIMHLITPKFGEFPRTTETRRIFKKLYVYFSRNKDKAAKLFGDLFVNKHKLYDDDEVAENIQKAEMLSELMDDFGIDNLTSLRQVLEANKTQNFINQRGQISQETLVSLGVTSVEELEEALKDKDLAAHFIHTSTPTGEMFRHVQGLIIRAKNNVIEYLKKHPHYDCTELEELATTVIGGIKKDGLMIHVVVRPSDNGEVIVYYNSEKDTLDYANAELWIDNGVDDPLHLTLGKILKKTGINRISV
jgi:hypothetical protein